MTIRDLLRDRPILSAMLRPGIRRTEVQVSYPRCRYSRFSRKDKLKHHERNYHGQFTCQFNHCIYGFPSDEKVQNHERYHWHHSFYECSLGSCARTQTSRFRWSPLLQHLEDDHMVPSEIARPAVSKLDPSNLTLTSAHFPDGLSDFQDCEGCIKKLKEAASGKEGKEESERS